jgi:thioredoxin-related protein
VKTIMLLSFLQLKKFRKEHRDDYSQVSKSSCTILPTGEIFLIISDGTVQYCIVLKKDVQTAEIYHILDIKGKVIG